MNFSSKVRDEFSFVRGNYLILVLSWVLIDFASEMPSLYYGPFVIYDLGATAVILGLIGFLQTIVLAVVQFPGGYLADRYGRKWLISTLTFGLALSFLFFVFAPHLALDSYRRHNWKRLFDLSASAIGDDCRLDSA